LPPTFIADALTAEVHQVLSLTHARAILEALESARDGRSARWLDIQVIGESGAPKTVFTTLNRLAEVGWASPIGRKGARVWTITDRGRRALEFARSGDSLEDGH